MFRVFSPEDWALDNLALIQIGDDDTVRLHRTLNPYATDGLQGEEYGVEWTLPNRITAARKFCDGFWKTWTDINGAAAGGISLYDQLCDEGARKFMEMYERPFVFCPYDKDAADAVLELRPGILPVLCVDRAVKGE